MKKYLNTIRVPILLAVINSTAGVYLYSHLPSLAGNIVFNIVRLVTIGYAAWLLTTRGGYGIWNTALAGFVLLFLDHVIIKGGFFLFKGEWQAFAGVIVSFFMFVLIAMVVAGAVSLLSKKRLNAT